MRVHTQVDRITIHHAGQLIRSMVKLAKDPDEIEFFLYSLNNTDWTVIDALRSEGIENKIEKITVPHAKKRSIGHGQALNTMLQGMDTSVTNIVADSDAFIVMPRWDSLVKHLIEKGVKTMGTPYEDIGGFSAGSGRRQTYKGLPNVIWMLLAPGVPWTELDMLPDKKKETALDGPNAIINGLDKGQILFRDVGWRIPTFLYQHQVPYITFKHVKPTHSDTVALKGLDWDYHEEYQLDGIPFCVHHRGASKHPFRKSGKSNAFYDRVWEFVNEVKPVKYRWSSTFKDVKHKTITVETPVQIINEEHKPPTPLEVPEEEKTIIKGVWFPEVKTTNNFIIAAAMPRSATQYMSKVLNQVGLHCGHERFFNTIKCGFECNNVGDSSGWACHYIQDVEMGTIPIWHMVRHPAKVIAEWVALDTSFGSKTGTHIFGTDQGIKWLEMYAGFDYSSMDPWERATKAWIEWNEKIENSGKIVSRFNIEKLDASIIESISKKSNLAIVKPIDEVLARVPKNTNAPSQPIKSKFSKGRISEELWKKLVYTASRYGYDDL